MKLVGTIRLGGDKSISHRVLMFGALISNKSTFKNISVCDDVKTTIQILKQCNISIEQDKNIVKMIGGTLSAPQKKLDIRNSGTTMRLMLGLLAGQNIGAQFIGDSSLSKRPMKRIIKPLLDAGANIKSNNNYLPIEISRGIIHPINFIKKTKSAQVKSSLIFAGLGNKNESKIYYNKFTRDHSENLLKYMGKDIVGDNSLLVKKNNFMKGLDIEVPGDISNASFIIAAGLLLKDSNINIRDVLYNNLRNGFLDTVKRMGANIEVRNIRYCYGENICDLVIRYSPNLKNVKITKTQIITMIDEIPVLVVLATQAKGKLIIDDASELRIKESDRINALCSNLIKMDADIEETSNGLIISGGKKLYSTTINDFGDHRIAMSFFVLNLYLNNNLNRQSEISNISFPEFHSLLRKLSI